MLSAKQYDCINNKNNRTNNNTIELKQTPSNFGRRMKIGNADEFRKWNNFTSRFEYRTVMRTYTNYHIKKSLDIAESIPYSGNVGFVALWRSCTGLVKQIVYGH